MQNGYIENFVFIRKNKIGDSNMKIKRKIFPSNSEIFFRYEKIKMRKKNV